MEKRVALVIGNGRYSHTTWLTNPPNDATAMAECLKRLDFEVLEGRDLDFGGLKTCIRDFGRALREAHVALLFYAGHGLQVRGENYVVPVDAALEHEADVQLELVAVQTILAQMEIGNRTSVVILDACRDNPLKRNLARAMGATRSASIGEGLGRLESGIGTYIAFATSPNKVASDGTAQAGNSPFTASLLRHIETPDASISDVMMRVRQDVITSTQNQRDGPQIPWDSSSLVAPFYFRRSRAEPMVQASTPNPVTPTSPAERDWERFGIAETEDVAILAAYIAQYENSERLWAVRAKQRLEVAEALIAEREQTARLAREKAERKRREAEEAARAKAEAEAREREAERKRAEIAHYRSEGRIEIDAPIVNNAAGRWFLPGAGKTEWFKDFDAGPEMVVVPEGKFMMGSAGAEIAALVKEFGKDTAQYFNSETPQHEVTIPKAFAVGRCAISVGQYVAGVKAGACKPPEWLETGSSYNIKTGSDDHYKKLGDALTWDTYPIVGVSWNDAQAYIKWLNSNVTGGPYRLLSEAEWEYVCRAGSTTRYWWSNGISKEQANYGSDVGKTVPVKTFDANPFGLYQVHGNVWEWCEDCLNASYKDKPTNLKATGAAWTTGDCASRVLRGGSWFNIPQYLRSASRSRNGTVSRYFSFGFRVARTF